MEELRNNFTKGRNYYPTYPKKAYKLLLKYKTLQSKLASRMMDDPEEVSFGNREGDKFGRVKKYRIFSGGRGKKSVVLLLHTTWPHSERMPKPKGSSSRRRQCRKEEEVEFKINVQEEDVDDYGDVGGLLFLQAMILQKEERNTIGAFCLLLDNQYIYDIFSNTWI